MELRKDYITDRYVIISESRGKRPHQFGESQAQNSDATCYFCPGNEDLTPPEIARVNDLSGKWKIRVFPNKFAASEPKGDYNIKTDNKYYSFSDAYGYHEVIAETPDHNKQMWDLSEQEIKEVLDVYCSRINCLSVLPGVKYVSVFKNHGKDAGTSIVHSHTQIIAGNLMPPEVEDELVAIQQYDSCPYCEIIQNEKKSHRRCFENDNFAAFTPYASRFHYEIWVFPKKHTNAITKMDDKMLHDLADMMKKVLGRLKELDAPFNFFLHYAKDDKYHFHISFCPRLAIWAGFEFATGITINSVSPEEAAKFYRGEN